MKVLNLFYLVKRRGFSFIEVLAAIAIIGIVTFLAIPNLIQIKRDGEDKMAVSRAEALNMAIASYVQSFGKSASWSGSSSNLYTNVRPYLAFAPTILGDYVPNGYDIQFPANLTNLSYTNRVRVKRTGTTNWLD